ncbi:MAG TPA: type VI secretion system contractile sheath large subunit [Gemmataceae bacterium]|nr:type VI secretion system contractile sheath large subunit [Gemmataceae bacterium]
MEQRSAQPGAPAVLTREIEPDRIPAARPAVSAELAGFGILDAILDATPAAPSQASSALKEFLEETSPTNAIVLWVNCAGGVRGKPTRERVARLLNRDIARLDALLTRQVNAVIHHPSFQKLEASWRGLRYLVNQVEEGSNVKVRILNASWKELTRDQERALEFDQSQCFQKIYEEEFGIAGGEPFGVLLGDYEIHSRPGPDHPYDDVGTLRSLSGVAAAAFAPFITGTHPSLLDMGNFMELERPMNLTRTFEQADYLKWRTFRDTEDARFVGLTLPHVLMRLPYGDDSSHVEEFRFREEVEEPNPNRYLWGNAIYAFGAVVVRSFGESGWLANIRGVERDTVGSGLVTGLPAHSFGTDREGVAVKGSTDAAITDMQEKELADLGFIPLCHCPDTDLSAFYSNQSVQRPKAYDEAPASANARLSAMLQYILCVSRFAHYLKVIARDKIANLAGPKECEDFLQRWLLKYVSEGDGLDWGSKAKFPLREGQVRVRAHPDKPGSYLCVMHLRPHFQLDQVATTMRLATELAPSRT